MDADELGEPLRRRLLDTDVGDDTDLPADTTFHKSASPVNRSPSPTPAAETVWDYIRRKHVTLCLFCPPSVHLPLSRRLFIFLLTLVTAITTAALFIGLMGAWGATCGMAPRCLARCHRAWGDDACSKLKGALHLGVASMFYEFAYVYHDPGGDDTDTYVGCRDWTSARSSWLEYLSAPLCFDVCQNGTSYYGPGCGSGTRLDKATLCQHPASCRTWVHWVFSLLVALINFFLLGPLIRVLRFLVVLTAKDTKGWRKCCTWTVAYPILVFMMLLVLSITVASVQFAGTELILLEQFCMNVGVGQVSDVIRLYFAFYTKGPCHAFWACRCCAPCCRCLIPRDILQLRTKLKWTRGVSKRALDGLRHAGQSLTRKIIGLARRPDRTARTAVEDFTPVE